MTDENKNKWHNKMRKFSTIEELSKRKEKAKKSVDRSIG